eukprot:bmy_07639T0
MSQKQTEKGPPQGRPGAPRQLLESLWAEMLELAFHKSVRPLEGLEWSCTQTPKEQQSLFRLSSVTEKLPLPGVAYRGTILLCTGFGWCVGFESCFCCQKHGDFVLSPMLSTPTSQLELKKPPWVPGHGGLRAGILRLITRGLIDDITVEPPSVGSVTDEHGPRRPAASLAYRANGQYTMKDRSQLPVYNGGFRFHNPGPIQCSKHSKTQ